MSRVNVIALVALLGVVVWMFTWGEDTVATIQKGAMSLLSPFRKTQAKIDRTVAEMREPDLSREELEEVNRRLELELKQLRIENQQLDELFRENNTLKTALKFQESSPFDLVAARVLSRDATTWYHTLEIDKGAEDGVKKDDPVVVDTGLVGKVTLAEADSSIVLLLTDEACKVAARVVGSNEQGLISGERGAINTVPSLRLRYLSKDANVRRGMDVISSGAGRVFPPNLPLGTIEELDRGDVTTEAKVLPAVDFGALDFVFVVVGMKR